MTREPPAFVSHPALLAPGFGAHHPLSNARQAAVLDLLAALGWLAAADVQQARLPSFESLLAFHDADYLEALKRVSADRLASPDDRSRYNLGTMECPVFDGLWTRARASVGGAILAADFALQGRVAFHPGGGTHHGQRARASGFCYLNDPVFAIQRLLDGGQAGVAYIDLDAHHGDGVEAAFQHHPRVSLFSIHEAERWPGTGPTGVTAGGRIVNISVPRGIGDAAYTQLATRVLEPWLATFGRDALVITLGADPLAGDPLSSLGLSNHTLWDIAERCIAGQRSVVILGGGGYNPWTTARLWAGFWGRLIGKTPPSVLPPTAQAVLAALDCDLIDPEDRRPEWLTSLRDR